MDVIVRNYRCVVVPMDIMVEALAHSQQVFYITAATSDEAAVHAVRTFLLAYNERNQEKIFSGVLDDTAMFDVEVSSEMDDSYLDRLQVVAGINVTVMSLGSNKSNPWAGSHTSRHSMTLDD